MLAIVGASGKLGYATLTALLNHELISPSDIIACTSSSPGSPTWQKLASHNVNVRRANFEDSASLKAAFKDAESLFLVSTPKIELDYNDAPNGQGREAHHITAIDAARSIGIKHVYYTSLAFGRPSVAGVMRAHIRTEEYLEGLNDISWTIIREGLYNESWPLYLGYYKCPGETRSKVVVAGDGLISWTAIDDLGLGNALILSAPRQAYLGKILYLSTTTTVKSLTDIASLVSNETSNPIRLDIVSADQYIEHYVEQAGMDRPSVEWWVSSYEAVQNGETHIEDDLLDRLLQARGVQPTSMETTISSMLCST